MESSSIMFSEFYVKLYKIQLKFIEIFVKILKKFIELREFYEIFEVNLEMFEHIFSDFILRNIREMLIKVIKIWSRYEGHSRSNDAYFLHMCSG